LDCESAWAAQEGGCEEDVVKDEEDEKDDMKDDVKDKSRTNILARPSVTLCDTLSSAVRNTTTTTIVLTRAIGNAVMNWVLYNPSDLLRSRLHRKTMIIVRATTDSIDRQLAMLIYVHIHQVYRHLNDAEAVMKGTNETKNQSLVIKSCPPYLLGGYPT
jgi:hypothetical protein